MNRDLTLRNAMCRSAKACLSSYRAVERSISLKLDELSHLRAIADRLAGNAWAPGTPLQDDVAQELRLAEAGLEHRVAELCVARRRVEAAIRSVDDEVLREILERRYLDAQTLEQIADAMHYTNRHVSRLHRRALELVRLPPPEPKA